MNTSTQKKDLHSSPHGQMKLWLWPVLLVLFVCIPYLPMQSHDFINWDDPFYIYNNPMVTRGLSWLGIGWAFVTGMTANWHPLTWLSHMLDSSLFGPTPGATHMVNLFWYMGCVLLTFLLFLRLGASSVAAFFMAAFFGLHPLHVESVAWASERKDLLCAFFFLSATLVYLRYVRGGKRSLYFMATILFVLSLLSKPMAVTWPCVALLLDYWPLNRFKDGLKTLLREKIPWIALTIFSSIITVIVQNQSAAVKSFADFPFSDRLANALISYLVYLHQTVWPFELTVFYPYPYHISMITLVTSCLVLGIITIILIRQKQDRPFLLWGWLFYLGVLFPVIGLVQIGGQAHADRYMLLPQLGLIMATGLFLDRTIINMNHRRAAAMVITIIIMMFSVLTFRQVSYWKNSKTLFNQNLTVAGENELAHFNLGVAYLETNEPRLAVIHFSAAAQMNPRDITTYNNMGIAYTRLRDVASAETCFRQAIFLDPKVAQPHFHLGVLKAEQGLYTDAIQHLEEAIRLAPQWEEPQKMLERVKNPSAKDDPETERPKWMGH